MTFKAVLFDLYGTLGIHATTNRSPAFLNGLGYERFANAAAISAFTTDSVDGGEHYEHSASEATYNAWIRSSGRG